MQPSARRPISWRRRLLVTLVTLVIGAAATGFGPPGLLESSDAETPILGHQVPLARRMAAPTEASRAVVIVDDASGRVLYGDDEHVRLPMASTTKMMTALVALERGRLDQEIDVTIGAADLPGSSVMGLLVGDRLTLGDMLYGLLLPSGNDAALNIAWAIGGSEEGFVELMNQRAIALGLTDTHFVYSHGLDDPAHYSTAADLAQIARAALRNPTFARIVATKEHVVRGRLATYELENSNRLLGRADVEGVKTGTTDLAGSCLVSAFRRDGNRVIAVVLNASDIGRDEVAITLADYAFDAFTWARPTLAISPFDVPPGAALPSIPGDPRVALPAWQAPLLRTVVRGDQAIFLVGEQVVGTAPLTVASPSALPSPEASPLATPPPTGGNR